VLTIRSIARYGHVAALAVNTWREAFVTKIPLAITALVLAMLLTVVTPTARAAPCLTVTLTGTMGGPPAFNGLAGPGTLVRYGDDDNNCGAVRLQVDVGRGTTMRLSQVGVPVGQLNAVFFTHMHSDHRRLS
jgi:ribonuclease Z